MSNAEQPEYKVVTSNENIEIRQYPPMIVAEVEVSGERKQAIREGFTLLADYTQLTSRIGFWRRRLCPKFEPGCIAQPV